MANSQQTLCITDLYIQDKSSYTVCISLISEGHGVPIAHSGIASTARNVAAAFLLSYSASRTRRAYATDLAEWFSFCETLSVDPLAASRAHVDAWARSLAEIDGRTPATVARKLTAVSGFYRYAVIEDVIGRNPVAAVRRPKVGSDTQSTGLDATSWFP